MIFRLFVGSSFPSVIIMFYIAAWIEDNFQFIFRGVWFLLWVLFVSLRVCFYFLVFGRVRTEQSFGFQVEGSCSNPINLMVGKMF